MKKELQLQPGKFYRDRDGGKWCCYRVRENPEPHAAADCIRVSDSRIEYFYSDGRYDGGGKRRETLVEECEP